MFTDTNISAKHAIHLCANDVGICKCIVSMNGE